MRHPVSLWTYGCTTSRRGIGYIFFWFRSIGTTTKRYAQYLVGEHGRSDYIRMLVSALLGDTLKQVGVCARVRRKQKFNFDNLIRKEGIVVTKKLLLILT